MRREEKGLWRGVIVLRVGMVVMGWVMVVEGVRRGGEEGEVWDDWGEEEGRGVGSINGEVIRDKE
ncbi:hypothetical protein, partial [Paenibacillus xylanexedens]|uniref:hypothetical protein n=1 Tax=Paenibacillus xylanexedens TaxID=528191 RepID=UPI0011A8B9AE